MRYYHLQTEDGQRLIARDDDGAIDLTAAKPHVDSFVDLARAASVAGVPLDDLASNLLDEGESVPVEHLRTNATRPLRPDEVWAAGVTYEISEEAREAESGMPEMYLDVYSADRPEIFFKATPNRTVGPREGVGIRADSEWDVPEPELGVVLYDAEIVGYTVGNDMSSRSIEGANPLYLPQAKVYDRCCAIGPCVASPDTVGDPHDLEMSMAIERDGTRVFEDATRTSKMARTVDELVSYYTRHNDVPEVAVLLTGTSLVPPDEFTLQAGDELHLEIDRIGKLDNHVVTV